MSRHIQNQHKPLSGAEVERMREIVLQHDRGNINSFDLNNPPKEPYKHQEFPKVVYDHSKATPARDVIKKTRDGEELVHIHANLASKIVHDEEQLAEALDAGFSEQPPDFSALAEEEEGDEPPPADPGSKPAKAAKKAKAAKGKEPAPVN